MNIDKPLVSDWLEQHSSEWCLKLSTIFRALVEFSMCCVFEKSDNASTSTASERTVWLSGEGLFKEQASAKVLSLN